MSKQSEFTLLQLKKKLDTFYHVYFIPSFVQELKDLGIPYASDWHMFMG